MSKDRKLIRQARGLVSLVTSYSKESQWYKDHPIMYEIFQESAQKLNEALGEDKWDWEEELRKDKEKRKQND